MRFLLVFFSAILAGYFAWQTARSSPETDKILEDSTVEKTSMKDKQEFDVKNVRNLFFFFFFNFQLLSFFLPLFICPDLDVLQLQTIQDGFWVFVDMASGRYLWRNLRDMRNNEKVKSC
jgi:hypothetical protein